MQSLESSFVRHLNIAMVAACPFPANRGTPSRVKGMAEALSRRGHRVAVVTYHFGLDDPTLDLEIHRTLRLPYNRMDPGPTLTKLVLLDPLLLWKLVRLLRRERFDVIHAHHFEGALVGYAARRLTGIRVIYDAHTTLGTELSSYRVPRPGFLMRYLDRQVPRRADHVIAVSETLRDIVAREGVPAERIDVVPTGAFLDDFANCDGRLIRDRYGLGDRPIIMYTGSLDEFQRVDLLIAAMEKVAQQTPRAVLMLVVAKDRPEIRRQCIERGITDAVITAVEREFEQVPSYLAAADVVVIPRIECSGIPQKLVNYMAAGKAIVSFEGSAKLLRHGENGLVVENEDVGAFANAIVSLVGDKVLRMSLGENARRSVMGRYDWDNLAEQLEQIYLRVARHRPGSVAA